jgi:nitrogen fixation NifU-like protein
MSEFDELYREVILDHYKNPRGHGVVEPSDVEAEGVNPLCGDEVSISIAFDGDKIEDVRFQGRGCAISQAATSMLMDMVKGRSAEEVAEMGREELLDEVGIPVGPVRLKCALLGLSVLRLALHKSKGTPLPQEWASAEADLELR